MPKKVPKSRHGMNKGPMKLYMDKRTLRNLKLAYLDWILSVGNTMHKEARARVSLRLMYGSCHFDKPSNDEFSVKFWMFVFFVFSADIKIRSKRSPIDSKLSLLS